MTNYKNKRISTEITRYVNSIILKDIKDELIKSITIIDTELNNDLSIARVFFTAISDLTHEELENHVNESSSFIRGKLSKVINLRHTPEILFVYDKSVEYGDKIEKLIKEINK